MKKISIAGSAMLFSCLIFAQQKEGKVIYERSTQMQFRMPGMNDDVARTRTDKIELLFSHNQSLLKRVEENEDRQDVLGAGEGVRIQMMNAGSDDVTYSNFDERKRVESRELFDRTFIIEDTIRRLHWKLYDETKNILGYTCKKATTQQIGQRTILEMNNGQQERKQEPDTMNIVAWYTDAIPVSAGPLYQGQLPGLILELNINNGRTEYKALEIVSKGDLASIKAPKGKKKYTTDEFEKERDKLMEEMRQNGGGRRMIFRN
jgi:GLPGLI family protein